MKVTSAMRHTVRRFCFVTGHDFSRAENAMFIDGLALAPAVVRKAQSLLACQKCRLFLSHYTSRALAAMLLPALAAATGCHSFHVETTVENRTGEAIQLLEVDYPSASFGAGILASGADFHYSIQLRGSGPVKVQYTAKDLHQVQIEGPTLAEPQEGQLEIVLLPAGKAEFHPQLSPAP